MMQDAGVAQVLAFWADVDALTPPTLAKGAARSSLRGRRKRFQGILHLGIFRLADLGPHMAGLLGVEPDRIPDRPGGTCYLATVRCDEDGWLVEGSFSVTAFAVRYATLKEDIISDPARLGKRQRELAEAFGQRFSAWVRGQDPFGDAGTSAQDGVTSGPPGGAAIQAINHWLREVLAPCPPINADIVAELVPRQDDDGASPPDFSFREELARVMAAMGKLDAGVGQRSPLSEYLTPRALDTRAHQNADDPKVVRRILEPGRWPFGKWPGRGVGGHSLVLRQQVAVNTATMGDMVLMGCNGPPGTGKTTLLRDIIAAAYVDRAMVMRDLSKPIDAFAGPVRVNLPDGKEALAWRLAPALRGHGILVCSSNNAAVENVTTELPAMGSLARSLRADAAAIDRLDLFRPVSDALAGQVGATWGTVSAALGNKTKCQAFAQAWLPGALEDDLPRPHVYEVTLLESPRLVKGTQGKKDRFEARATVEGAARTLSAFDEDYVVVMQEAHQDGRSLSLVLAPYGTSRRMTVKGLGENAPHPGMGGLIGKGALSWTDAVSRFDAALRAANGLVAATESVRSGEWRAQAAMERLQLADAEMAMFKDAYARAVEHEDGARERVTRAEGDRNAAAAAATLHQSARPGWLAVLLRRDRAWHERAGMLGGALGDAETALRRARGALEKAQQAVVGASAALSKAKEAVDETKWHVSDLKRERRDAEAAFGDVRPIDLPDPGSVPFEEVEKASPWSSEALDLAREEVFLAAVGVHRAFLASAAPRALANMRLMARYLMFGQDGRAVGAAMRDGGLGGNLWDTLFLSVPVISSTFASVGTMFGDTLGERDLGWLMVDEAGQAVPFAAVGALWRSRRALVVGDPMQIAPIVSMPASVVALLMHWHGVAYKGFNPHGSSVQAIADARSALGVHLGGKADGPWLGCPLRVHRRCAEPMFAIANRISYFGTMVLGRPPLDLDGWPERRPAWGPGGRESAWFDLAAPTPPAPGSHWSPEQGRYLLHILLEMTRAHAFVPGLPEGARRLHLLEDGMPAAFVITPFATVRDGMKGIIMAAAAQFREANPTVSEKAVEAWTGERVGTVHAFQGKEAETVFLLLGSHASTPSAVSWAGRRPNLLNVAATRARESFYVVGDVGLWTRECPPFRSAIRSTEPTSELKVLPAFVPMVPDQSRLFRLRNLGDHLNLLRRVLEDVREQAWISSPYVSINAVRHMSLDILTLIKRATTSGKRITIFCPNEAETSEANERRHHSEACEALVDAGAELVPVERVHSKTLCMDDRLIAEGSFNWLSASRNERYAKLETSFLYEGMDAAQWVRTAVSVLEGRGSGSNKAASSFPVLAAENDRPALEQASREADAVD